MRPTLLLTALLFSSAALAQSWRCTLDDCVLADNLHQLEAAPVEGAGWMVHDLALARQAQRDGDRPRAGQLASSLHYTLERQGPALLSAGGEDFVIAMHAELAEILEDSGYAVH